MDILEPTIGNLIREVIPGAPKRQKALTWAVFLLCFLGPAAFFIQVAFAMEKGAVVDLPHLGEQSFLFSKTNIYIYIYMYREIVE